MKTTPFIARILLVLLGTGFFSQLKADHWDCMSRPVADRLVEYLSENPYLVDYCDPCASFEEGGLPGYLIRVESARIVVCTWDPELWSVEVDFETIAWGMVTRKGVIQDLRGPKELAEGQGPEPVYRDDPSYRVTLNYHWSMQNGKPIRLGIPVGYEEEMGGENGFVKFPKWRKVADRKERVHYLKWLREVKG